MALTDLSDKSEKTSSADALLSVKEAADLLRMSDKWLYQSDIPFVRMGRRRLYFRTSLLEYARQRFSNARSGAK
jgi:excisionase family DNA binding protein